MVFQYIEAGLSPGGYDDGYRSCCCFWGTCPGSLILELERTVKDFHGKRVLDAGCGEAKNALYLARKGAYLDAYDISEYALNNASNLCKGHQNINLKRADVTSLSFEANCYDVVIAYGLLHCIESQFEIEKLLRKLFDSMKNAGYFILCSFNARHQELDAHPGFMPTLLEHEVILSYFAKWNIVFQSDADLHETHPNNNIPHTHSMTRLIAQKTY